MKGTVKMNKKISMNILGVYDLILALGAIWIGIMMVSSKNGMFSEYPREWLTILPFQSWLIPGVIAIVLFGLGNIMAAIASFKKSNNKPWFMSVVMGGILLISLGAQVVVLGECYLATAEFFIIGVIQLYLSGNAFVCFRK